MIITINPIFMYSIWYIVSQILLIGFVKYANKTWPERDSWWRYGNRETWRDIAIMQIAIGWVPIFREMFAGLVISFIVFHNMTKLTNFLTEDNK